MRKLLSITLLGVLLLTACATGEDLQGRLGTSSTVMTMSLSSESPSGARTVSSVDEFIVFDVEFNRRTTLPTGTRFRVDIRAESTGLGGAFDPTVSGKVITLKQDGTAIGTGTFSIIDTDLPSEGTAYITTTSAIAFTKGDAKTFTLVGNTSNLLAEQTGVDDTLDVIVEYNGQQVTGNTLVY
ncbi:MAG: hypothetical protein WC924_03050 [Candidatus Gracilibacteria bacterium]